MELNANTPIQTRSGVTGEFVETSDAASIIASMTLPKRLGSKIQAVFSITTSRSATETAPQECLNMRAKFNCSINYEITMRGWRNYR